MFDSISDNPSQVFEIAVFMVYFSLLRNISKYTFGNVSLKYKSEFELIWVPQLTFCYILLGTWWYSEGHCGFWRLTIMFSHQFTICIFYK